MLFCRAGLWRGLLWFGFCQISHKIYFYFTGHFLHHAFDEILKNTGTHSMCASWHMIQPQHNKSTTILYIYMLVYIYIYIYTTCVHSNMLDSHVKNTINKMAPSVNHKTEITFFKWTITCSGRYFAQNDKQGNFLMYNENSIFVIYKNVSAFVTPWSWKISVQNESYMTNVISLYSMC